MTKFALLRSLGGNRFDVLVKLAGDASLKRKWRLAAKAYKAALARRPELAWVWVQYGHVLKEAGQLGEASLAYQAAVDRDPRDEETHYHLAFVLNKIGQTKEAERVSRRALLAAQEGSPPTESLFILLNRVKVELSNGDHSPTEVVLQRVLDDTPSADLIVQYANALKDCGRPVEAEAYYEKALALAPRRADTHLQLGHALKLQGRRQAAIQAYRVAAHLAGPSDQAGTHAQAELDQLAAGPLTAPVLPEPLVSSSEGSPLVEALAARRWVDLAESLSTLPAEFKTAPVKEVTAQILMMIGERTRALEIIQRLIADNEASELGYLVLARDSDLRGDKERAAEFYSKALRAKMCFGEAFEGLVGLGRYERIFEVVEKNLFPTTEALAGDDVHIAAGGRTPGLVIPAKLAAKLHTQISEMAASLEEKSFNAQARLFREDAAHFRV